MKIFFIKLTAITLAIIIIINATFNVFFADKLEIVEKILSLNKQQNFEHLTKIIKNAIITQLKNELTKDKIFSQDEIIVINKFTQKIQKQLQESK
jgi:hypothetical protein